jgi:hypothetical protein
MSSYILERISGDISFQMVAKPSRILSNGASRCGVRPGTPHFSGFRVPCIWAFLSILNKNDFSEPSGLGKNADRERWEWMWQRIAKD